MSETLNEHGIRANLKILSLDDLHKRLNLFRQLLPEGVDFVGEALRILNEDPEECILQVNGDIEYIYSNWGAVSITVDGVSFTPESGVKKLILNFSHRLTNI